MPEATPVEIPAEAPDRRGRLLARLARDRCVLALYLGMAVLIYWNVIEDGVFLLDDLDYVTNNPAIRSLASAFRQVVESRYLGYVSFAINYSLSGLEPTSYHLGNVLIHVLNAFLTFRISRELLERPPHTPGEESAVPPGTYLWSAFAGLLFLVHPLHTQAVSYVSQRFTSLCALFYLLSVFAYLRGRRLLEHDGQSRPGLAWYLGSAVACLLAAKTKEIAFTLPAALLLLEWGAFRQSRWKRGRYVLPLPHVLAVLAIPLSLYAPELGLAHPPAELYEAMRQAKRVDLEDLSPWVYAATQTRVLLGYLRLFVLPVGLRAEYDVKASSSFADLPVILSSLALGAILLVSLRVYRRAGRVDPPGAGPYLLATALGTWLYFLASSVESGIIPIKHLAFEHRAYLPGAMLSIAAAGGLGAAWVSTGKAKGARRALLAGAVGALLALGVGTHLRNRVWTDEVVFWTDVVEKSPGLLAGYHNRALAYRDRGLLDLALADMDRGAAHFHASFRVATPWPDPDLNPENAAKVFGARAKLRLQMGALAPAQADFLQVLAMARITKNPRLLLTALLDIANHFRDHGHPLEAVSMYSKILERYPNQAEVLFQRARTRLQLGEFNEATRDLDALLSMNPTLGPAYYDRAVAFREMGRKEEATADLEKACRLGFEPACAPGNP